MTGAAYDCDVLIIGLGPVGAMLGTLLAQSGISTIAVEKDHEVYPLPRAAHFDHEVMRIFQAAGVADAVLPHTRPAAAYEFRSASGEILLSFGSPTSTASGWAQGYMFHQPAVENALRAAAGLDVEDGLDLVVEGVGAAENFGGLRDIFAVDARVGLEAGDDGVGVVAAFALCDEAFHLGDHAGFDGGIGEAFAESFGAAFAELGFD